MDRRLQERMIGAGVLIVALVVVGPMILDGGPSPPAEEPPLPAQRGDDIRTHTFHLGESVPGKPAVAASSVPEPANVPATPSAQPDPLRADAVPVERPMVAAPAVPVPVAPEPPARPKPAPALSPPEPAVAPAGATPKSAGQWVVQVGTFGQKGNADRLSTRLREQGFEAFVSATSKEGRTMHRVRVGPSASRDEANSLAKRLAAAGHQGQVVSQ